MRAQKTEYISHYIIKFKVIEFKVIEFKHAK